MPEPEPELSHLERLKEIQDEADTLRVPSGRTHYTFDWTGQDQSTSDQQVVVFICDGDECAGDNGSTYTIEGLTGPSSVFRASVPDDQQAQFDQNSGLATFTFMLDTDLSILFGSGAALTENPSLYSYGVWGESGSVFLQVINGSIAGELDEVPLTGNLSQATAFIMGQATRTNPQGTGSATWEGIAEAVSISTFARGQGSVSLTIADLSQPSVSVDIDVPGFAIDDSSWTEIPLTDGRFMTGTVGTDYIDGDFHGENHSEAYGVFDTGDYLGGFGATRQ